MRHYELETKVAVRALCETTSLDLSNREKPFKCSFCGIRFKTEWGAHNHRDKFHYEEAKKKIRDAEIAFFINN